MRRGREPEELRQARAAGLDKRCARLSAALRGRHPTDTAAVVQPTADLIQAYSEAKRLAEGFARRLTGARWPVEVQPVTRPNGVKSLDRIVEKYLYSPNALTVPLDMLAGKIVVDSLWDMYDVANSVAEVFAVVAYRDRVVRKQGSGYRDLQFVVNVDAAGSGHRAELKVMHRLIDELDAYEHRLYEIRRGLETKQRERQQADTWDDGSAWDDGSVWDDVVLTPIERLVLDTLDRTSADLFEEAWKLVLAAEKGAGT